MIRNAQKTWFSYSFRIDDDALDGEAVQALVSAE